MRLGNVHGQPGDEIEDVQLDGAPSLLTHGKNRRIRSCAVHITCFFNNELMVSEAGLEPTSQSLCLLFDPIEQG